MEGGGSNSSFQPFSSLQNLIFENMPSWKEWLPFEGNKRAFPRLITLELRQCPGLRGHLPSHLSSQEEFKIKGCDNLLGAPHTRHWLSSIKKISVQGDSLFEGTIERTQWSLLESDSPCLLQKVSMDCCHKLLYVPKMILSSTCLQHLKLSRISSLTAFPDIGLPTSLRSLKITECENLSFLPPETWSNYKSLVTLKLLNSCHTLKFFLLDGFPALESLEISECRSLESFCISEICYSPRASTLQSLRVHSCNALLSLPQQMDTFTALEFFSLSHCRTLRSLPQRMDTLISLRRLLFSHLPELELSFSEGTFLPAKLHSIMINSVGQKTSPVTKWGLQRLDSLAEFEIFGNEDIINTLLKDFLLPISLFYLRIDDLSKIESIERNGLRYLSSLKRLHFCNCPTLESFPEDIWPSSLSHLEFHNCARLASLPEDSLPSSLKILYITECPLLEARYGSQSGEHWSKISHIPVIQINDEMII